MTHRPPRSARLLLAAVVAPRDRSFLLDDLDEMHAQRASRRGRLRADLWYVQQVIRSVPHLAARRLFSHSPPAMRPHPEAAPDRASSLVYALRHAFRRLIREPAFTAAAVLTLALGVGGSVAVFAVVEAVLLRPLPYPDADRLAIVNHRDQRTGITKEFVAIGDYVDLMVRQASFNAVGAYGSGSATIFGDGEPYRAVTFAGTAGAYTVLGVKPVVGRSIEDADTRQGAAPVVMLSYEYWRDKMGSDPRVVGTSLEIGQQPRTIVGVGPKGFQFRNTKPFDLLFPMVLPREAPQGRKSGWTFMVGRLKPGVTMAAAATDLAKVSRQMEQEFPDQNTGSAYYLTSLRDTLVGNTKPAFILILAAVGVVLLIACVNVANLLLARSLTRRREMAVRMALGAGRRRLAGQLLSESFALASLAAVCGVAFAAWGAKALVALVPQSVQSPGLANVHINGQVLAFTLLVTIATTIVFGLAAMTAVRLDGSAAALSGAGRASQSTGARRAASTLVAIEVALAIMLLFGAGLVMRTFGRLLSVDPGFTYDRVMTLNVALPADRYRDSLAQQNAFRDLYGAIRAVPGVQEVGYAAVVPLTGNNWTVGLERADKPLPPGERPPEVGWQVASGSFFKTLGIPLLAGRLFDETDVLNTPHRVIVSEAIQKRYFPDGSAVGKLIKQGKSVAEIVGVVGDIRRAGLRDEPRADMYMAFGQSPAQQTTIFVRTAGDPANSAPALQAAIKGVEPKTIFINLESLASVAAESVRTTKLVLWLLEVFAATALILAAVGIFSVMSYVVRQRTREIGTRIALGATRRDIMWLVMRQGAAIGAAGAAAGLFGGVFAARSLQSILYGVTSSDPLTMAVATMLLVGVIVAACYAPARRAAAVDPARTLADG